MKATQSAGRFPWQPVTAGGLAAFASAAIRAVVVMGIIVQACFLAAVFWLVGREYVPAIETSFAKFPDQGVLAEGRLIWNGPPYLSLYETSFIHVVVNHTGRSMGDQGSDLGVEITPRSIEFTSLLGVLEIPYKAEWDVAANRQGLQAWWGAWKIPILLGFGLTLFLFLTVSWMLLASLYFLPVLLVGRIFDRAINLGGAWKLSCTALYPGALFISVATILYGLHIIDLQMLMLAQPLHVVVGWVYLFLGIRAVEKTDPALYDGASPGNPFGHQSGTEDENPFEDSEDEHEIDDEFERKD